MPVNPPRWDPKWLQTLRDEGDPVADTAVLDVYARGDIAAVNAMLDTLVHNDGLPVGALPAEVQEYLVRSAGLPPWMDPAKVRVGEELFMQHGVLALAALLCAALPACYTLGYGVQVLALTQGLSQHTTRRLFETAQMVVEVMAPGGLEPHGQGVIYARKVRLMHAAMRHLILATPPVELEPEPPAEKLRMGEVLLRTVWRRADWGVPINQEDQAFTLLTFSHVILEGLATLGVPLTGAQRDAYIHCWSVVGYVMGVREDLLARTAAEAKELYEAILAHQSGSSDAGRALARALIGAVGEELQVPWVMDKARGQRVAAHLIHRLLGDRPAQLLGIDSSTGASRAAMDGVLAAVRGAAWVTTRGAALTGTGTALGWVGRRWVARLTRFQRNGQRGMFHLPSSLRDAWNVGG